MSYLRYLTFKSLRHFHPNSEITLYISTKSSYGDYKWVREKLEFENTKLFKDDYTGDLKKIGVNIIHEELFPNFAPNYQSDLFRWWVLKERGGFYLDTDQIITKSWEKLPLDKDFIYCSYVHPMHGLYCPVGVLGSCKNGEAVTKVQNNIMKFYNANDYNSIGPNMFIKMTPQLNMKKSFNAPMHYFYPTGLSDLCWKIFSGTQKIVDSNYAVHWFGGHPNSQKFNAQYTEDFAKTSNDSISSFLRNHNVISID